MLYKYLPFFFWFFLFESSDKENDSLSRHLCWCINLASVFYCHPKGSPGFPLAVYSCLLLDSLLSKFDVAHTVPTLAPRQEKSGTVRNAWRQIRELEQAALILAAVWSILNYILFGPEETSYQLQRFHVDVSCLAWKHD